METNNKSMRNNDPKTKYDDTSSSDKARKQVFSLSYNIEESNKNGMNRSEKELRDTESASNFLENSFQNLNINKTTGKIDVINHANLNIKTEKNDNFKPFRYAKDLKLSSFSSSVESLGLKHGLNMESEDQFVVLNGEKGYYTDKKQRGISFIGIFRCLYT